MCSFGSFDGVPSCANKRLLQDIVRGEWGSSAVIQSDCCDSVTAIKSEHNYTDTFEEAVAAAFNAGLQMCFVRVATSITSRILTTCADPHPATGFGSPHQCSLEVEVNYEMHADVRNSDPLTLNNEGMRS